MSNGVISSFMRTLFIFFVSLVALHAEEWVVVDGGLSPDKRLGVAVYPQKNEFIDEADGTVLLVNAKKRKIIGPLEEVDSTGGTWGKTLENVRCEWSSDSRLLAINFRIGRLMYSCQIYRIDGSRAIPFSMPDPRSHSKGQILDYLDRNANPGQVVRLGKNGQIIVTHYGFMPKKGHESEDFSRFGIKGFEQPGDSLSFAYELDSKGDLRLVDVTAQP
jgi:hypothetical protein